MAELAALPEEQVVLEWNETSMILTVSLDGGKVGWLSLAGSGRVVRGRPVAGRRC